MGKSFTSYHFLNYLQMFLCDTFRGRLRFLRTLSLRLSCYCPRRRRWHRRHFRDVKALIAVDDIASGGRLTRVNRVVVEGHKVGVVETTAAISLA